MKQKRGAGYYSKAFLCSAILVLQLAASASSDQRKGGTYPQQAEEHLRRAKSLAGYDDPRAESEYRLAIKLRGGHYPQALLELSRFVARNGSRFSEAADLLETYINETSRKDHTDDHADLGRLREAASLQDKARRSERLELAEFLRLTTLIAAYGRSVDAVPLLERAAELYPTSSTILLKLASTLKAGDKDRILGLLYKALEVNPDSAETHAEAGWLFFTLAREIDEAIVHFNKAITLSSGNNVSAWRGLAYTLPYRGRNRQAIEAFQNYWRLREAPSAGDEDLRIRIEQLQRDPGR